MKKTNKMTPKAIVLVLALAIFVSMCAVGCSAGGIREILTKDSYTYVNPDETLAETDAGFVIENEVHKAKLYIPEDSQLVSTLLKVYTEQTGLTGKAKCIGGGTYAKMLPNTLAFGPIFPGDEVREHKPDEYIGIDNLMKNAQIIAHAMYAMAK